MSPLFFKLMMKIVRWADPKAEKYRPKREPAAPYTPASKRELMEVMRRCPEEVLSGEEREIIAAAMSFGERPVSQVMLARADMTFVHENDFLGPLMLDKLHRTGFLHFPVLGASGRITGLLHTKDLNDLKIRETDRALKYLDENVYYIREDHTLAMALAAFIRTNCHFFIVIDRLERPVGLITYEMVAERMLGRELRDDFAGDLDAGAVARRG
jgi:CBS domain containing-hemolysin-like protein